MKIELNLYDEQIGRVIDQLTIYNLKDCVERLEFDLKKDRPMIFHDDPYKDKKKIKKHIDALNLIIDFFTK